jgi:hypothetical protein
MTLQQFLEWLVSGGGAAVVLSFVLERIPAFQKLEASVKGWINLGGVLVLSLGAFAVVRYVPADVLSQIAPWFGVVFGVVSAWLIGQLGHKVDPVKIAAEKEKEA